MIEKSWQTLLNALRTFYTSKAFDAGNTSDTLVVFLHPAIPHRNPPRKDLSYVEVYWRAALSSFLLSFHRSEFVGFVLYSIKNISIQVHQWGCKFLEVDKDFYFSKLMCMTVTF